MSRATAAALLPQPTAPREQPSRRLTPVAAPARRRRPKLVYALTALAGAALIGAAQIGLSLAITHDAFVLSSLTSDQRELDLQTDALKEELAGVSSPQLLAIKAADLGMVVAGSASYLRLSDAAVLGSNAGAEASSTIDPNGSGAVYNTLLERKRSIAAQNAENEKANEDGTDAVDPNLPPPITDGLPSPETR